MNVTIIGSGNMGRGIGTRAVAGGHSVTFVDANPEVAEKTAADVKASAKNGAKVSTASLGDAELGDVVVLAVWYGTNIEIAKQLGTKLAGKVVVDIANPLNSTYDGLATAADSSSAEDLAKAIASGAKVVKAFNTTYAGTLIAGEVAGQKLDVFIAGDDADAKAKVAQLVTDGGLRAVDAGPLSRARQIEGMQLLHIVLQGTLGTNWGSALKILG
ncbi:MAG: NAD(P)-binding domain-containing protein [Anaerolineales bacterium]|uniref:NADPH-dependent F420 reductase n=1 Tax=Candidatus Villigracilis affinis TaxID=3140682 RepID=UPI002A1F75C7|nr:NAD(P)-binding domain-containing protein [Anaerolineales bacterium]MBL0347145.1 NAD(P)-binding domain-containing protein [Anaerolineales bacterium]